MLGLYTCAYGINPDEELIQAASRDELTMDSLQNFVKQGARANNIKALFAAIQEGRPNAVSVLLSWSKKNALLIEPYPISAIDSLLNLVEQKTINITCCQLFTGRRWHSKITEMLWTYKEHLQSSVPNAHVESVVRNLVKNVIDDRAMINSLTTSIVMRLRSLQSHNNTYFYTDVINTGQLFLRIFKQQKMLRNTRRSRSTLSTHWATEITPIYTYKVIGRQNLISQYRLYGQNLDSAHEQLEGLHPVQDPIHNDLLLLETEIQSYSDYIYLLLQLQFEQELLIGTESHKLSQDDLENKATIENHLRQLYGTEILLPNNLHLDLNHIIAIDSITGLPFIIPRYVAILIISLVEYVDITRATYTLDMIASKNPHIILNQQVSLYDLAALKKLIQQRQVQES